MNCEDIRIELTFNQERDGWLYGAIREHLQVVKPRNRGLKIKQLVAAALTGTPSPTLLMPVTTPPSVPEAAMGVPSAHQKVVAPPSQPEKQVRVGAQTKTQAGGGYGDALNDFNVELPGV